MKEHIEQLNRLAECLYTETRGKYTVSRETAKTLQMILDDMLLSFADCKRIT